MRESESRFRQLAERIENVFWIWEPSEERFIYVSPAYETIWQRPCEAVLQNAQVWQAAVHADDRDHIRTRQIEGKGYDEEYRIIRPDGTIRWIRDRAFPILDFYGRASRLVGIAEDITDLKRQEQALRLIFEGTAAKTGSPFFQSLVRYLADVLQVSYALITRRISPHEKRVRALAFWQKGDFGENHEFDARETPCDRVLDGEVIFHSDQVQAQYPGCDEFAHWQVQSYLGVPLTDSSNTVIGHLVVMDDRPMLTDQPRELILKIFAARAGAEIERQMFENEIQAARESADAANHAKSEFLANISHELRTPLNTILGFTQLILTRTDLDAKIHTHLEIVNRSGEHLLTLINDVLEMSRIEAGKLALNCHAFNLRDLLQTLEDMFLLRAKAKHLTLTVVCTPAVPSYIETDESKLRQVLINLLGNAVKFTEQGQVILRVDVVNDTQTDDKPSAIDTIWSQSSPIVLSFEVEDTGPGIAPMELKTLFEPFAQTTAGRKSQEGTGLGLLISQRFVQLMGGLIQVQTEYGNGSTFSFQIPVSVSLKEAPAAIAIAPSPEVKTLAPGQPTYRLLVVDDHEENRLLLVSILETAGFSVKTAADGYTALEQACAWRPHLIWMDIRMPGMDGYEATRQIKAACLHPAPVIIALTASAFEEDKERALAAGCEDFVRKPFQTNHIFRKIDRHLSVQYLYETADSPVAEPLAVSPSESSLADRFAQMPPEWLWALRQAAIRGADEQVLHLAQDLAPEDADLAQVVIDWARNFQFDAILHALPAQ